MSGDLTLSEMVPNDYFYLTGIVISRKVALLEVTLVILAVVIFSCASGFLYSIYVREERFIRQSWGDFAQRKGFNYSRGKVTGKIGNFPFLMWTYRNHNFFLGYSGKYGEISTILKVEIPGLPKALEIGLREEFGNNDEIFPRSHGLRRMEVGDANFDNFILLAGSNRETLVGYLNQKRREAVKKHFSIIKGVKIKGDGIYIIRRYKVIDGRELEDILAKVNRFLLELI